VAEHGGTVDVESNGGGSRISAIFPVPSNGVTAVAS